MRVLALIFSWILLVAADNLNIPSPHLVPLPPITKMGEETLPRLSFSPANLNNGRKSTLASPLGRGARQRVRGWDVNKKRRVVSTSLCGDSYVLDAVDHNNIAALSWQSGDDISTAPDSFDFKPKASDDTEVLLSLNPTLVVFGPGEGTSAKPLLDKLGIKYVSLVWGEDFASVSVNLNIVAEALGLDPITIGAGNPLPTGQPTILYLSASGATAGPGTYIDAAIRAAGGSNIITTPGWHTPSLESLVSLEPDLIVTSFFKDGYASVNEAGLRNKVLKDKIKSVPRVNVPGKLWPCAGPGLYGATDIIKTAIEELN